MAVDVRTLPQDLEAEAAVLGSMLCNGDCIPAVRKLLSVQAFNRPDHWTIFCALCELHDAGKPIDEIVLCDHLGAKRLEYIGGLDYLLELYDSVPSAANAEYYAGIVAEKWRRREAIAAAGRLERAAYDSNSNGEYDAARMAVRELLEKQTAVDTDGPRLKATPIGVALAEPQEEIAWLVDGLLPSGGFALLVGKPKAGKTTTARCLALAVARGERFIGRACPGGPVLYLAWEDKRAETVGHFRKLGAADEPLYIVTDPAAADYRAAIADVAASIRQTGAVLAVVDTLARLVRCEDFNDYAEVNRKLEPLIAVTRQTGCCILALHHAGKDGDGRDAGDAVLGSTGLFGSCDSLIVQRRDREGRRIIETRQRYTLDVEPTVLGWDPERRAVTLGATVAADIRAELARTITETLAAVGEPMTKAAIRESVAADANTVTEVLNELFTIGRIDRLGTGKRGDPFLYAVCAPIGGIRHSETDGASDGPGSGEETPF